MSQPSPIETHAESTRLVGGFPLFGMQPPDLLIVQDESRHLAVKNAVFLPINVLATKKALSLDWIVLELPRFTISVLESRLVFLRIFLGQPSSFLKDSAFLRFPIRRHPHNAVPDRLPVHREGQGFSLPLRHLFVESLSREPSRLECDSPTVLSRCD